MREKTVYEYAVIRLVPKVEREEFVNVGLILCSRLGKYIRLEYEPFSHKTALFTTELDLELAEKTLEAFKNIAEGRKEGGELATLDLIERFRWITAEKSTCIQTSPARMGITDDFEKMFEKLYDELVR